MLDVSPTDKSAETCAVLPSVCASAMLLATETAMTFDMRHVLDRYRKEQTLPETVVLDHHRELMRFLAVSSVGMQHDRSYGMMGAIDELWHTFVIFTREYARFCDVLAGEFLHHVPAVQRAPSFGNVDGYDLFLNDYRIVFGEAAPKVYWPALRNDRVSDMNSCGVNDSPGCSTCNAGCGCGTGPLAQNSKTVTAS